MEKVSDRLQRMSISATLAMSQKSRELQVEGFDVINLSIGEPDFDTPIHVKEAAKQAIDDNFTHYPPVPGFESFKKAIVNKFKRENNLEFDENQIVVSAGAKHSIINVFMAILDSGDEVIIPAPYWVSYIDMVELAEGTPVVVKCSIESDFKMTPEQLESAITPKTKAIIYSSPSNPTGSLYTKSELEALANVLAKYPNITILSDEIYEHINFVGEHQSIAQFKNVKDRVVVINGVSKGYAMTGWRIGYVGAPLWIAKAVTKLQGQFTSGVCTIAQKASEAALNAGSESCAEMKEVFHKRRDLVLGLLKDANGLKTNTPLGAFYVFPEVSYFFGKSFGEYTIETSSDLAMYILETEKVATVGGDAFGSPECLRFSYATSEDKLIEAISRIKRALDRLN